MASWTLHSHEDPNWDPQWNTPEGYLSELRNHAALAAQYGMRQEVAEALCKTGSNSTKIFYTNGHSASDVNTLAQVIDSAGNYGDAVCIIENFSPETAAALGCCWKIYPTFFIDHAFNPPRDDVWKHSTPFSGSDSSAHINGIFEYHGIQGIHHEDLDSSPNYFPRHCFRETWNGIETINSNTRISYYRVSVSLYLILVDAPLSLQTRYNQLHRRSRPSLRLPYSLNRGGIQIPRLLQLDNQSGVYYSLFESLKSVFLHGWLISLLFKPENSLFPINPFCYILSSSLWQTNLLYLTQEIQRISFQEIRNPDTKINEILHDRREDLVAFVKSALVETTSYIPEQVIQFFDDMHERNENWLGAKNRNLATLHHHMLDEAIELERFLMDTFQLLMSSISVQDARLSVTQGQLANQQALRATQLTTLASIYVPLSFITGIFGMNLKELNGSSLSIWVFFVAMVIAAIVTAFIFWVLQERSKHKSTEKGDKMDRKEDSKIEHLREASGFIRMPKMRRAAWKSSEKEPRIQRLMA